MSGTATAHVFKRIPLIKFPQRRPKLSDASPSTQDDCLKAFLSRSISGNRNSTLSASGKASDQPKRAPLSNEEIEAILLGGCI